MSSAGQDEVHITRHCFGCGTEKPAGLRLRPWREGPWTVADFTPAAHHRGFTRVVHGGIVAALLDELVTTAAALATCSLVATAKLEIEFRSPMKLGQTCRARARYLGEEGSLHAAEGEVNDASGRLVARARGLFAPLTPERAGRFLDLDPK